MNRIYPLRIFTIVTFSIIVSCGSNGNDDKSDEARLSPDELDEQFGAQLEIMRSCDVVEDCVSVFIDCPLPCAVAVNVEYEQQIFEVGNELLDKYYSDENARCVYDCDPPENLVCEAGKCDFDWENPRK